MTVRQDVREAHRVRRSPDVAAGIAADMTTAAFPLSRAGHAGLGSSRVLQALRAFAALLVVLYHTNISIFRTARYWPDQPFGPAFNFGHAGVEFFFVLSGFIIFAAHRRDIGVEHKLAPFLWKRFRRIYPVYWVMLALVVPLYFLVPSFGSPVLREPGVLFDSVLLLHLFGHNAVVLTVSWTLFHEVLFYGVFALLVLNRTLGAVVMAAWMAGSVVSLFAGAAMPEPLAFCFSPMHLLFGMGIGAAWSVGRRPTPLPATVVLIGAALFFGAGAEEVWAGWLPGAGRGIVYGIGSTLLLLGALGLERSGRIRVPRALVFLGDASYSVYLVHFVALSFLAKLAMALDERMPMPHALLYLGLASASVGAGLVFHRAVEVPLLARLGKREAASAAAKQVMAAA